MVDLSAFLTQPGTDLQAFSNEAFTGGVNAVSPGSGTDAEDE